MLAPVPISGFATLRLVELKAPPYRGTVIPVAIEWFAEEAADTVQFRQRMCAAIRFFLFFFLQLSVKFFMRVVRLIG